LVWVACYLEASLAFCLKAVYEKSLVCKKACDGEVYNTRVDQEKFKPNCDVESFPIENASPIVPLPRPCD
jgi:hypothetical protein